MNPDTGVSVDDWSPLMERAGTDTTLCASLPLRRLKGERVDAAFFFSGDLSERKDPFSSVARRDARLLRPVGDSSSAALCRGQWLTLRVAGKHAPHVELDCLKVAPNFQTKEG